MRQVATALAMVPIVVRAGADASANGQKFMRKGCDHAPMDFPVLRTSREIASGGPRISCSPGRGLNGRPHGMSLRLGVLGASPHDYGSRLCAWTGVVEEFVDGAARADRDTQR